MNYEEIVATIVSFISANIATIVGIIVAMVRLISAIKSNDRKTIEKITANVEALTEQNNQMATCLNEARQMNNQLLREIDRERKKRYHIREKDNGK